jgi:hypothetical protein
MDIHVLIPDTAIRRSAGAGRIGRGRLAGRLVTVVALALGIMLSCTERYNPFADYANADIAITYRSLAEGDTVEVFGAETLRVIVTVKELVERFSLSAPNNRLWGPADTVIAHSAFSSEPFLFRISYYDTGWQDIVLGVSRTDGTIVRDTLTVYAALPLGQDTVRGHAGDSVTLRTRPVADRDAAYYWSFGEATRFIAQSCSTRVRLSVPLLSGMGAVWVSDGTHATPADSFPFALLDTVPPEVVCVNDGFVGDDTIVTGDSWMTFKVRIADRGDEWVDSVSVNGVPFDTRDKRVYYKLIDKLDGHGGDNPLRLDVFAMDNFQFGNVTRKTFWVVHSDTIARTKPARIVVQSPEADTTSTSTSSYHVFGTVEYHSLDTMRLTVLARVNDSPYGSPTDIRDGLSRWEWDLPLRVGDNHVSITAFDFHTGNRIDWSEFVILRDSAVVDTLPPRIIQVTADGKPAHGLYTTTPSALLEVRAVDQETGIDTLTVNGKALSPVSPSAIAYRETVLLRHSTMGNEIVIRAVDGAGNEQRTTVVVFKNRLPLIDKGVGPALLSAESLYVDTIGAGDPDGDTVTFDKVEGPAGLSVTAAGGIAWMPLMADTGMHTVTVRVWDGYQPVYERFTLYVYAPWDMPPGPVRLRTRSEDFAPFLEADSDTLRVTLAIEPGTGIAPFTYSARFVGGETLLGDSTDSTIVWAPAEADTGYRQMVVVVEDRFPSRDTIYPRILVVPPNRPGVIVLRHDADTLADGTIDLNAARGKDTLVFVFVDEDSRLTERYSFVVRQSRSAVVASFDSAVVDSYELVVDPGVFDGYDTLSAILTDRGGYRDTLVTPLYYGVPPEQPVPEAPGDTVEAIDSSVTLRWRGSDPDGDSLWYSVYLDTTSGGDASPVSTPDTVITIGDLQPERLYYWRIVAHDWKRATPGPLRTFYLQR